MLNKIIGYIISIAIAQGVGGLSAYLSQGTMGIYQNLNQPSFAPPGWLFGVAWTILYTLMGIAAYRVYDVGGNISKNALVSYGLQLVFNFMWTIIFFRLGERGIAFGWLIILLALIIITTVKFYKVDNVAGYIMIPYILWVSFAGVLNYAIWQINK